jgi:hypothetical protein
MAIDKAIDSTQLDSDLTSVANAIRTKGGTSASLAFPAEFVSAINAISGGGSDTLSETLLGTISAVDTTASRTTPYLFYGCTALKTVNYPNAEAMKNYMFGGCSALESLSAGAATSIESRCFDGCSKMGTLYLPNVTAVNGGYNFNNSGYSSGWVVVLPALTSISTDGFRHCKINAVDIGAGLSTIPNRCFYATGTNDRYDIIILRRTSGVVALSSSNSLTLYSGTHSDVYVPSALKSIYETASNWSTLVGAGSVTFHAIEGSIYETKYADGTPIPT